MLLPYSVAAALAVVLTAAPAPTCAWSIPPPDSASVPTRLWESSPASDFGDSFMIGNGRLGAALAGTAASDTMHVNEDSFWSGDAMDRVNQDALSSMPTVQEQIRSGENQQIVDAGTLASYALAGTPARCASTST